MENGESSRRPHERLDVWQDSMALVEVVYRLSRSFPDSERFGLISQTRRCAVSVPSNIAEGAARRSTAEYVRFLSIARGSLSELDTQFQIATRLGYMEASSEFEKRVDTIFARITALMNALEKSGVAR